MCEENVNDLLWILLRWRNVMIFLAEFILIVKVYLKSFPSLIFAVQN